MANIFKLVTIIIILTGSLNAQVPDSKPQVYKGTYSKETTDDPNNSDNYCLVEGHISDRRTGTVLEGVIVQVDGNLQATKSDGNGNFQLKVPDGKHSIRLEMIGYTPLLIKGCKYKDSKQVKLNIEMGSSVIF